MIQQQWQIYLNCAPSRPERRASETSHARLNLIVTVFTRVYAMAHVDSPSLCRETRAPAVQPELRRSPVPISLLRRGRGGDDLEGQGDQAGWWNSIPYAMQICRTDCSLFSQQEPSCESGHMSRDNDVRCIMDPSSSIAWSVGDKHTQVLGNQCIYFKLTSIFHIGSITFA